MQALSDVRYALDFVRIGSNSRRNATHSGRSLMTPRAVIHYVCRQFGAEQTQETFALRSPGADQASARRGPVRQTTMLRMTAEAEISVMTVPGTKCTCPPRSMKRK